MHRVEQKTGNANVADKERAHRDTAVAVDAQLVVVAHARAQEVAAAVSQRHHKGVDQRAGGQAAEKRNERHSRSNQKGRERLVGGKMRQLGPGDGPVFAGHKHDP
jgi:hypothetical protein